LPAATSAATNHLPSGSLAKSIDRLEHLLCHRSKVALPFDFHSLKTDTTCAMPSHLPTNRPASALTMAKAWTQMSSEVLATRLSKIALSKAREALRPHAPRLAGCCKPQISQPSLVSYRLVVACQQAVSPAQGNFCRRSSRPNREEKTPPPPRQAARGSRFANDVRAILLAPDDPARGQIFFPPQPPSIGNRRALPSKNCPALAGGQLSRWQPPARMRIHQVAIFFTTDQRQSGSRSCPTIPPRPCFTSGLARTIFS
jgi:hypothetical protein